MSFDKPTRNKLANMVGDCRRLLTEDNRHQLQAVYGLQPDGTALPVSSLSHLDERGREVASALRLWQEHLASTEAGTETQKRKAAFDRLAHETAFTVLNRLAALRMCEERGHVIECVRRGLESDGFALYERFSEGVLGGRGQTYRIFLERMFAELSVDLGALFDLDAPQSLVFPRERCLEEVLSLLNRADLAYVWANDETIGWIYQYFNSKEEREAMREASAAPRNSRELAVRNQFFTPRYVVEFLVDNTLGRIWYDMRQGQTALEGICHYLVRRPSEIFLSQGQQAPSSANARKDLSQDELIKQPVYVPYRAKRDPRTLKILDPAVGSGHFLLYAFDLLETIYQEAWEETNQPIFEATGKTLRVEYEDLTTLRLALPELILRHNLHGIDIDLRACQIAVLALWLRAQHAYQHLGLKSSQRPKIERSNIVCAEPMPGEQGLLDQFLTDLQPKVIGQLVQAVFEKMKLAGEAGPLLKIEAEIAEAVAEAKLKWLAGPKPEQGLLFADLVRPQQKTFDFDFSGITDEAFWEKAEERIYAALQSYAEQAENGRGYQRRLFAHDAARGFAFVDLCRGRYDVLLMNPPFGDWSTRYSAEGKQAYPNSYNDILAAFVERGAQLIQPGGRIGAITSRTCFFLSSFTKWRELVVLDLLQPALLADLGNGVMDTAMVEAAAYVLSRPFSQIDSKTLVCFRVLSQSNPDELLRASVASVCEGVPKSDIFSIDPASFRQIPTAPLCYWAPRVLIDAFAKHPKAEDIYDARLGMQTNDDEWMVRLWTEIPVNSIDERRWAPYSKGGYYSPFYADLHLVVLWDDGGRTVRAKITAAGDSESRYLRSQDLYGTAGLNWPRRTTSGISVRPLPQGAIFGEKSPTLFAPAVARIQLLGLMNSQIFAALVSTQIAAATTAARSYEVGIIQRTPIPMNIDGKLADLSLRAWQETIKADGTNEVAHAFVSPSINASAGLADANRARIGSQNTSSSELLDIRLQIDDVAYSVYGIYDDDRRAIERMLSDSPAVEEESEDTVDDVESTSLSVSANDNSLERFTAETLSYSVGCAFGRWDIRRALNQSHLPTLSDPFAPLPPCSPGMLQNEQGLPVTKDDIQRLQAANRWDYPIEIPWDGILIDDPDKRDDIIRRLREILASIWKERADAIEQEACDILEVKDLREYFRKPTLFFADHLKRYFKSKRQAPIYWPLGTASGSYTLWIYYHRLNDDSLYTALNKYVKPKIDDTEKELRRIESELPNATGREASSLRTTFEETGVFLDELRELRDELARVADLPYKPNLNDGVLITASPLWKLFRLPKWRKELQECWKKLESGNYDWAHLAYSIWPDRVRDVCKSDRSIAIAHDLESLCELAAKPEKKKRSKKIAVEETVPGDQE